MTRHGTMPKLALLGGPKAVTLECKDTWDRFSLREAKERIGKLLEDGVLSIPNGAGVIEEFEHAFCQMVGTQFALTMNSGTATLHSAYVACGVGPGTEVLVPSYTWHASVTPILHCSATPVFCDIEPNTLVIDPADAERKITKRTKAICVVHTWGNVVDMVRIMDIANAHGLMVIEDASHAHGALHRGRPVGGIGHIGCFSMQGAKAVSGGEAGVATTNDPELFDRMVLLGHFGRGPKGQGKHTFDHLGDMSLGAKYRPHPFAIVLAHLMLERLPELNRRRSHNYTLLNEALHDVAGVEIIEPREGTERGGYLEFKFKAAKDVVERVPLDRIEEALQAEGAPVHKDRYSNMNFTYGLLHQAPLFSTFDRTKLGGCFYDPTYYKGESVAPPTLPVTEDICRRLLSTEAFTEVNESYLFEVAQAFRKVFSNLDALVDA